MATTLATTISPQALADQLNGGGGHVQVLDVRTPAEFESAHIPGSLNLPVAQLREYATALSAASTPLVVTCQQGPRAREASTLLRAAGRQAVQELEGGVGAWERAGLPLDRGRQRWGIERQVRGVAGSLVLAGALGGLFVWKPLAGIAAFIGGGLLFSALTDTCGMANLLERLPYNQGPGCDAEATVAKLTAGTAPPTGSAGAA
jgi:rhodanese-related sulfurtransferase